MIKKLLLSTIILSPLFSYAENIDKPFCLIINPGDQASEKFLEGWDSEVGGRVVYNWAKSHRALYYEDKGPIIDNVAKSVSTFGSTAKIRGIKPGRFYRVRIDFAVYKIPEAFKVYPALKIFIDNKALGKRYLKTVTYNEIDPEIMYRIDIPLEYSNEGSFDIIFGDYSMDNRIWGIWDIIITSENELPDLEWITKHCKYVIPH